MGKGTASLTGKEPYAEKNYALFWCNGTYFLVQWHLSGSKRLEKTLYTCKPRGSRTVPLVQAVSDSYKKT